MNILIFIFSIAILGVNATAAEDVSIKCTSKEKVSISGTVNAESGKLHLEDPKKALDLNSLTQLPDTFDFKRITRVREKKFSFAKFSSDATAWESFGFALPKDILSGEDSGRFKAYFTVYFDNGNGMAAKPSVEMNCSVEVNVSSDVGFYHNSILVDSADKGHELFNAIEEAAGKDYEVDVCYKGDYYEAIAVTEERTGGAVTFNLLDVYGESEFPPLDLEISSDMSEETVGTVVGSCD